MLLLDSRHSHLHKKNSLVAEKYDLSQEKYFKFQGHTLESAGQNYLDQIDVLRNKITLLTHASFKQGSSLHSDKDKTKKISLKSWCFVLLRIVVQLKALNLKNIRALQHNIPGATSLSCDAEVTGMWKHKHLKDPKIIAHQDLAY